MFRLTRQVRFTLSDMDDASFASPPSNSYGGYPSYNGSGSYQSIEIELEGPLDPNSGYLRNIKEIDQAVRERLPALSSLPSSAARWFESLRGAFGPQVLRSVTLRPTPFLSLVQLASEYPMQTRFSQKFEFSASHRLHNPKLSEAENRTVYGKCNNRNGHGHNYEVQVTLRGTPNQNGLLVDVPGIERIVKKHAIDRMDHQNLNMDVPEFAELIPTVENIAMVIYRLLKGQFASVELAGVTVWETPKTWCEYSE